MLFVDISSRYLELIVLIDLLPLIEVYSTSLFNSDLEFIWAVLIILDHIILFVIIQIWEVKTKILWRIFVPWWWSLSVIRKCCILVCKVWASIDSLVEEVNPWSLAILLMVCRVVMDRLLSSPYVSITTIRVSIIQILGPIWFFLSARWPLPLLKLQHLISFMIVNWNYWTTVNFSNQILEFVLNFRLLFFQIFWLEGRLFGLDLLLLHWLVLRHCAASSPRLEVLLLIHLLDEPKIIRWDLVVRFADCGIVSLLQMLDLNISSNVLTKLLRIVRSDSSLWFRIYCIW